jgi:hypothetical protein
MTRTVLLLIASSADEWTHSGRADLARRVFDAWWQGASTIALCSDTATETAKLPVPVEQHFELSTNHHIPWRLALWLCWQRVQQITIAGPDADAWAARLRRRGFVATALNRQPVIRPTSSSHATPSTTSTTAPVAALPWRLA